MRYMLRALMALAVLSMLTTPADADPYGWMRGSVRCGLDSFAFVEGGADSQCQAQVYARATAGRVSFGLRADSDQKSGLVEFGDPDLWQTFDAHLVLDLETGRSGEWQYGVSGVVGVSFAWTDTVERFGRELEGRPVRYGGGGYARKTDGTFIRIYGGRDDLANEGRFALFGTVNLPLAKVYAKPLDVSIDVIAPVSKGTGFQLNGLPNNTWVVKTGVVFSAFTLGAGQ